jgi:hypothetical protein
MSQPKSETSKAMLELLEAPIAFHRAFVKIGGGVTAGLLLSQAFYWSKNRRAKERGGWFYKSHAEWEEETGLTRREQQTARDHLREKGLLEEKIDALPGKGRILWFRVNVDGLHDALKALVEPSDLAPGAPETRDENEGTGLGETATGVAQKRQTPMHETARPIAQKRQTSLIHAETTAETTTKTTHTPPRRRRSGCCCVWRFKILSRRLPALRRPSPRFRAGGHESGRLRPIYPQNRLGRCSDRLMACRG